VGAYRGNVFNELLDRVLILELRATTVWARIELDLNVLIDLLGVVPEGARMSVLAPRRLRRHCALLWLEPERSSLTVRGALGGLERRLQLGDAFCSDFQLLVQRSVLGSQGLEFGRHLAQTLSLPEGGLE
jgi:hypothetical protein